MTTKKHNYAIDICKAFATLMVINSHMQVCYPEKYQMFASGGAIGNALFFFCSGFTLFLGNSRLNFFDWYKKRVSRIIPSVLAMAIVVSIVWGNDISMPKILIGGGYWFISCILAYYVVFYPIKRYLENRLSYVLIGYGVLFLIVYYCWFYSQDLAFYGDIASGLRQTYYFLFMLLGGIVGKMNNRLAYKPIYGVLFVSSVVLWYVTFGLWNNKIWMPFSLVFLMGVCYFGYLMFCSPFFTRLMTIKGLGNIIYIVGCVCLESYLIQFYLFTDKYNYLFPFNIPVMILCIVVSAYVIHAMAVVVRQTFQSEPYNWKEIIVYQMPT